MHCPDLRQLAAGRYRLWTYAGERVRPETDPWLLTILCQTGHVYPHGPDRLAFASNNRGGVARAVASLPGAAIEQEGTDGINVSFPVEAWPEVAKLVRPRRRRQVTPEQRARLAEMGSRFQFRHGAQSDKTSAVCVRTG